MENIHLSKKQKKNLKPKDVIIKIGIVGIFHEDNMHLISGGTCTFFVNTHIQFLYQNNVSDEEI